MAFDWRRAPIQELMEASNVRLRVFDRPEEITIAMAVDMIEEIRTNNDRGAKTCMIVPVGPTEQYIYFSMMVNTLGLDLSNVHFFNMDEYLDDEGQFIPADDPLSFRGAMNQYVYDAIDPKYNIPAENRWFPTPGREEEMWERICGLGGVDVCYGGIGINGHIAFNESADPATVSVADFGALPTRKLPLTRETIATNSRACLGEMPRMPRWAMTIGMRECLSARRIVIHAGGPTRAYQLRRAMCGGISPAFPISYLQGHPDATLFASADSTAPLVENKGYLYADNGARDALGRSVDNG